MSDTTAPSLFGLTLPTVLDLSKGSYAIPVTARARDTGGSGVNHVVVYFDKELSLSSHWGSGKTDRFVINGLFSNDTFNDDTPDTAVNVLSSTNLTLSGDYRVTKVAVEDVAGNRTVYSAQQLQAMGVNTTIKASGGLDDLTPPQLLKWNLPGSIDVGSGQARLSVSGEVQDAAGGSGASRVSLSFDRPLAFLTGTKSNVDAGVAVSANPTGQPVLVLGNDELLSSQTVSGSYTVTKLTVWDFAGNASVYTTEQLKALGINTQLNVTGGATPVPVVVPTASLGEAVSAQGFVMKVGSSAWSAGSGNSFKLVIRYDPTESSYVGASLGAGANGTLSASVSENGTTGTVTITGSGSFPSGSGIEVSLRQLKVNDSSSYQVQEFTVNGAEQGFPNGAQSRQVLQGSGAGDKIMVDLNQGIDGGMGHDTAYFNAEREGMGITRTEAGVKVVRPDGSSVLLANVERLAFHEDYVVFDQRGLEAQAWRLYRAAFDRAPDKEGLGFWISQLEHGMSLKEVAGHFSAASEFGPISSDVGFVQALYRNVFDREPDTAGYDYWLKAIANGTSHQEVLIAFSESGENVAQVLAQTQNGIEYTLW